MTFLLARAETRGDKAGQGAGRTPSPELQLMGTATMQAIGHVMAEDHLSLLPHHHHPFLPLVMWFSYTRVSKEDEAQINRNKNI